MVASDDAPGAGIASNNEDLIMTSMKTVTVTVTDVEETGIITLTPKNPHVNSPVTANLFDGDGQQGVIVWSGRPPEMMLAPITPHTPQMLKMSANCCE